MSEEESLDSYAQRLISSRLMNADVIPQYLSVLGYEVRDSNTWGDQVQPPMFRLRVEGHEELQGHTYYSMVAELAHPGKCLAQPGLSLSPSSMQWALRRRLLHLRLGLHDPVKQELRSNYVQFFGSARFARRGGLPGTTERLDKWCKALGCCLGQRGLTPATAAALFKVLGAPCASSVDASQGGSLHSSSLTPSQSGDSLPQPPSCFPDPVPMFHAKDPTDSTDQTVLASHSIRLAVVDPVSVLDDDSQDRDMPSGLGSADDDSSGSDAVSEIYL